jgi:hypothetical protein
MDAGRWFNFFLFYRDWNLGATMAIYLQVFGCAGTREPIEQLNHIGNLMLSALLRFQ